VSRIWDECCGRDGASLPPFEALRGSVLRLVESQEQVATSSLVDSAAEQALLEQILERSKPAPPSGAESMHYLMQAPFRYPPLAHGSRFGSRFEPSIFYGSRREDTVLAEGAYYRFWFWRGMSRAPAEPLRTQHTVFKAGVRTLQGLRLQDPPFDRFAETLRHPSDYRETQALGAAMRAAGVSAFEYLSARDPDAGLNVAVFHPSALLPRDRILAREEWACTTGSTRVVFFNPARRAVREFPLGLFLLAGEFPAPA
jgi:hypothetical protein